MLHKSKAVTPIDTKCLSIYTCCLKCTLAIYPLMKKKMDFLFYYYLCLFMLLYDYFFNYCMYHIGMQLWTTYFSMCVCKIISFCVSPRFLNLLSLVQVESTCLIVFHSHKQNNTLLYNELPQNNCNVFVYYPLIIKK